MEDFNLRKYLTDNRLLKEITQIDLLNYVEKEAFIAGWNSVLNATSNEDVESAYQKYKANLNENKQIKEEMDAPYDIIQNTLKQLAGYWPADIKNNLDSLGAEEFKKQLDDLKPYIDQYFGD